MGDRTRRPARPCIRQSGRGNVFEEVEILLRFSIGSHVARGYEINFRSMNSSESYTQIVRWNGALGSFTELDGRGGSGYGIREATP